MTTIDGAASHPMLLPKVMLHLLSYFIFSNLFFFLYLRRLFSVPAIIIIRLNVDGRGHLQYHSRHFTYIYLIYGMHCIGRQRQRQRRRRACILWYLLLLRGNGAVHIHIISPFFALFFSSGPRAFWGYRCIGRRRNECLGLFSTSLLYH